MRLLIPKSLVDGVRRNKQSVQVELSRSSDTGSSDLMVVPAHPGALNHGFVVPGLRDYSYPGEAFVIMTDGILTIQTRDEHLADYELTIFDIDEGKDYRRQEVLRSPGYNPDDPLWFVGLGSLGSTAAMMLARSGWRNFVLIEPDSVEGHNLIKSTVYTSRDIGYRKVDVMESVIRSIEPGAKVVKIADYFSKDLSDQLKPLTDDMSFPKLVFASADSQNAIISLVDYFDCCKKSPFLLFHLCFTNALSGLTMFWDPHDRSAPCPNCLFMANDIYDPAHSPEAVDPRNYSTDIVTSTPQLGIDISYHTSLAVSYAVALLTGNEERLKILAKMPWLYTVALRYPPPEIDWIDPDTVGMVFPYPGRPERPVPGCPCCRRAGRVGKVVPEWDEEKVSPADTLAPNP